MIYGANGYCGRLLAGEAVRRGFRPLLAGRRASAVEGVAAELNLAWRAFDLADGDELATALRGVDAVLNCAGPFLATSQPMISGCLETGTHYVDITGEIDVFVAAQQRHAAAQAARIVLCPGAGFDVVPTDSVAAVLKQALPDATHLALGFDVSQEMSPGSAKTIVESLKLGCRIRQEGEIVSVPFGHLKRTIDFGAGAAHAVAIAWGDVATAFFSTGIPNIEVYLRLSAAGALLTSAMNWLRPLLQVKAIERALSRLAQRTQKGPSEREFWEGRSRIWGEVRNTAGATRSARLTTPNPYRLTIDAAMMALEHVLTRDSPGGFYTPSLLMGARCVESLPGAGKIEVG